MKHLDDINRLLRKMKLVAPQMSTGGHCGIVGALLFNYNRDVEAVGRHIDAWRQDD